MGVGGSFWDLLKPYARHEDAGYLRGRRVAVDLPFWIISHTTAIRARSPLARRPHLRTTFFRTLSLFAKLGAFPVFVVDGEPSPLKSRARAARFGTDPSASPSTEAEAESSEAAGPVKGRSAAFTRHVEECVEMLQYLGMPILRANGEAEALCAQLNNEGLVDACITSDSDAFLFGAKTVIKVFRSNCKVPFECYHIADIESGLGLKRKQMAWNLKDQRRYKNWQIKALKKIAAQTNFPNEEIIKLYLSGNNWDKVQLIILFAENGVPLLSWNKPDVEALVDLLTYKQNWEPSYIRQRMFPMLSTIYLREMASSPSTSLLLYDQYEFHSIQRIKIRHGYPYYLVKWKRATHGMINRVCTRKPEMNKKIVWSDDDDEEEATIAFESPELLDESDVLQVLTDDSCSFLLTDEDIQLVSAAFPMETKMFQQEQRLKEVKSRARKSKLKLPNSTFTKSYQIPPKHVHEKKLPNGTVKTPKGPRSSGVQLSIKDFYRSTKGLSIESGKQTVGESSTTRTRSRKSPDTDLSQNRLKTIRRRLHFD
ncbi:hypothetical protein PR202_gb18553 [Eleusine coracana subsp. coracana]|uniref:XPG-I domain-containing protein n=1 Tax=Eleusine coracana subsp. coracana TaxID=191504 RepID=A0AAV5F6I8_ELECO|nr:hypothetical protein PR202_gb18553 [Eleusine coracana subsp. coracana]